MLPSYFSSETCALLERAEASEEEIRVTIRATRQVIQTLRASLESVRQTRHELHVVLADCGASNAGSPQRPVI